MPRTTQKVKPKTALRAHSKKPTSVDKLLTEYLTQAEHNLIEAVKLFSGPRKPDRRVEYYQRLERAQEAITALLREELVRLRGPIRKRGVK